ncbi:MAG TPA: hypothetical protein PLO25_02365 [Candidatus Saccharibacteria bacterium]|nr:hypothetical protein [Candidatus Saccharibacteria bacterium]
MIWCLKLIKKINQIKSWQVAIVIALIGLAVFFSGLNGGFQGDDTDQIIKNEAIRSLSNIGHFFSSSTFWNGERLVGDFYRPMMTTTYAFIYALFGTNPIGFHVVQLILYMACAFFLFLFLRTFFKPTVALFLALIFLVHPINSQPVFSIPSMQEPLMFLSGISALYLLTISNNTKRLFLVAFLLFLSLMSKETAVIFICLAVLYEFLYDRERLFIFIKIISAPIILFLILRISAVGLRNITLSAPIDLLSFGERMITVPSIIMFYINKFFFPCELATSYYWTYKTITFEGFVIPLVLVLLLFVGFTYAGFLIYKNKNKKDFFAYIFFGLWTILGMSPHLQIIALDMTACETWFIVPMVGFLGILALIFKNFLPKVQPCIVLTLAIILLILLGARTNIRGLDYQSQVTLSLKDITVTEKNYLAMNNLAKYYIDHNEPKKAQQYAEKSVEYFPAVSNYINLGVIKMKQKDYVGAKEAYMKALSFYPLRVTYENIAIVNFAVGESSENIAFLKKALSDFPNDSRLWNYLAIEEARVGNNDGAKNAILNAYRVGPIPPELYDSIINKKPLDIPITDTDKIIQIRWN